MESYLNDKDVTPFDIIKGTIIPKEKRDVRLDMCHSCDRFLKLTRQCGECHCFMALKTWIGEAHCPIGLWGPESVSTDEEASP